MKLNMVPLIGMLLFTGSLPSLTAQSQTDSSNPNVVVYKPGQVWTTDQGITVTILAIEDVHRIGKVVHVRVDKIPWQSCGNVNLTRAIEHLAITEKMMRKSGLVMSKDAVDLPESSIDAYRKWQGQKKHEIAKVQLQQAILEKATYPGMICNFLPSQT